MSRFSRLRTQLILSHLAAIALTLVSMVAAVVLIASGWLASQTSSLDAPTQQAETIAGTIDRLVLRGDSSAALDPILADLARGDLRPSPGFGSFGPGPSRRFDWWGTSLDDLDYVVVIGANGQPLASSEPDGAAFAPAERAEWTSIARAALAGERNPGALEVTRAGPRSAALGAAPILDANGRPVAAVVVALASPPPASHPSSFWNSLFIFGAASAVVLSVASVFALAISGVVGYLLSRRLVTRLERLGQAAESLASGDLSRRVQEGPPDEVGQLARRFNAMAERLATTVGELDSARRSTEAALVAKRELVANVSHELRTPLALIRGHVESLLMRADHGEGERRRDYLAVIDRETENLSRLIEDLFTLSTTEAGALPLVIEPVSLAEVVEEVAASIRSIARRERRITVATAIAPDLAPVLADRRRIGQILANLLRNALRHTPEGGLIAVRAMPRNGEAWVTVEDTGEGIPSDRLPHVFERFYRGDDARDRASGGAGLGLAIVRELVEAMGGRVAVESTIGQGTRFSFSLPLTATVRSPNSSNHRMEVLTDA
ncbi:MAG: sensor histidine kinase [Chloroflexota bacterium]